MEIVYLLCSIVTSFVTSLTLSLLLPFRTLYHRSFSNTTRCDDSTDGEQPPPVSLYQGTVWHERRRPVHHSFRYDVRYAFFDLDRATHAPLDHLSADEARRIAQTKGPVFLLTIPSSVGYEQNPLSLYYCYDLESSVRKLKKCIAEVTNTPWGERVTFIFDPDADLVAKPLHVSPFMDMLGNWRLQTNAPADNLFVAISVQHPKLGNYFSATLRAKRVSSLEVDHALFFWLMPHKVALWIYWHALKLWWKNVPVVQHPKYQNSSYREEAMKLDKKLERCPATGWDADKCPQFSENELSSMDCKNRWDRQFAWRDARWPWS